MKKLFFLGLLLSNFFGLAQDTLIPDLNFEKALISEGIDNGVPDGRVLTSKISVVTSLDLSYKTITDLTGIEDFSSLTSLRCSHNQLNFLNLNNPLLQTLICMNNQLTSLNISKCLNLKTLWCFSNQLINLDITTNIALEFLFCIDNKLTDLDFFNNTSLIAIDCSKNQLISLDVSNNKALSSLDFNNNKLNSLDITKNNNLIHIFCHENQLNSLNLKNGTNTNFATVNFKNNPSLTCIQIDNKANSDTNWSLWKDSTASFSENCNNKTAATPPKITATGNQIFCKDKPLKIIPDVTIAFDPLAPETDVMYVQISSGYVAGFDLLSLANFTIHQAKNIFPSWDSATGKLKLYSPTGNKILYTDFVAALKDVIFSNSETPPSGARTFSITIGQANYLPSTQHFYEYVPSLGISWTDAKAAAESRTYFGLKGYLATVMAADEAQLTGKQSSGAGWIGGSDAQTEGVWKWVTGPEGLMNSGNGVVFWNGMANGTSPNFAFWNTNEPNQFAGANEDYAHITAPGVGITGAWNDLTITGDPNGSYQPKGYIVEYGGMPGDPILQIAASTSITIPTKIEFEPASRCFAGSLTLKPKDFNSNIRWYDVKIGGTVLTIANTYSPNVSTTTSYFVDTYNGYCPLNPRIEVIAKVISPSITSSQTPTPICGNGKTTLNATASTGSTLKWYDVAIGGTSLGTGLSFTTSNLSTDTTFYVDATEGTCVTTRTSISATVLTVPTIASTTPATRCDSGSVSLEATADFGTLNWYDKAIGGTLIGTGNPFTTPSLITTTPFYVDASDAGCTSLRTAVEAKITKIDSSDETVVLCSTKTVTINAPISGLDYLWSPGGEINESIDVTTIGDYTVFISSPIATSCGSKKTFNVIERPAPIISTIDINENSISIKLTDPQDYYEFSIDGELFQKSNQFNYIQSGTKTAYVRDNNSCDLVSLPFTIFSIAAYFTPNNDGFNDTWLIPEMKDYPGSNVKIFNRYGKLLKQMNAGTVGWSGKFNNQDLPADDYWYVLKLNPTQPEIRGHFTLKR